MKGYTGTLASGEAIHYVDRKRWFWLLSVVYPLQPFVGLAMHASTGNEWWLLLPVLLNYGIAPLIDMVLGEDTNNPPEEVLMQLDHGHLLPAADLYRGASCTLSPCWEQPGTRRLQTSAAGACLALAIVAGHDGRTRNQYGP